MINRRDMLKLAGLLPLGLAAPRWTRSLAGPGDQKNVIVLVFDALSAYNLSLHGYQRETTPNLRRLAKRAIVYHNHFAASNFTSSGTASLLTGTLPWTNRAIEDNGRVAKAVLSHNIFDLFEGYYRTAFSHNCRNRLAYSGVKIALTGTEFMSSWPGNDENALPPRCLLKRHEHERSNMMRSQRR